MRIRGAPDCTCNQRSAARMLPRSDYASQRKVSMHGGHELRQRMRSGKASNALPFCNVVGRRRANRIKQRCAIPTTQLHQFEIFDLLAASTSNPVYPVAIINTVHGKEVLGEIDSNGDNAHGLSIFKALMKCANSITALDAGRGSRRSPGTGKSLSFTRLKTLTPTGSGFDASQPEPKLAHEFY